MRKKSTYWLLAISCWLLAIGNSFAQVNSLSPTVIGSAGNYSGVVGGISISSNVGESAVTTLGPTGGFMLTQGFVQPFLQITITSITANPNDTICLGKSTSLTVNAFNNVIASTTYSWSPTSGLSCTNCSNPVATPTISTTYTVTVADGINTTGTDSIRITVLPLPTASISVAPPQTICAGHSITLTNTVSGGTGAYTYSWSNPPGGTTVSITDSPPFAGNFSYTATVTDAYGCSALAIKTVTVNPNPSPPSASANPNPVCSGNPINLSSTAGSSYSWNGPNGYVSGLQNPSIANASPANAGTYSVTTTNSFGCTSTAGTVLVVVNPVPSSPTPGSNSPVCLGQSLSLTATLVNSCTYSWLGPNGFTSTAQNPTIANASTAAAGNYSVSVTSSATGCTSTVSITPVTINPLPAPTINGLPTLSICNGTSAGLSVSSSTGTSPFTYLWSTSQTTSSISVSPPTGTTTYTAMVSDIHGCSGSTAATVTVNATPTITATAATPSVICSGQSTTLSVTISAGAAPFTYSWSSANSSLSCINCAAPSATPTANSTYSVYVYDANGCQSNLSTVGVTVNPTPTISVTPPTSICSGTSKVLSASSNAGNYLWSTGATTNSITVTPSSTTNYTVTGSSGSCSASATTTVTSGAPFGPVISKTDPTCNGACNGTASATVSGGYPGYTYAWSPSGGSTAGATNLCAANYTLLVTDALSCTNSGTIAITQPTVLNASISSTSNVSCKGGNNGSATVNASGGTSPYTFAWSASGGSTSSATGLAAGNYSVTVSDNNGCTTTNTVSITQPAAALTASISASSNVSCNGGNNGNATVNANGGTGAFTYSWAPLGGNAASATGLTANNYSVTVTDNNGCTNTQTVSITQPNAIANIFSHTNVSCTGGNNGSATATISGGTSPYTFLWSSGSSTSAATALVAGSYTLTIKDANGCSMQDTVTITQPTALSVTASTATTSCSSSSDAVSNSTVTGGTSPYTFAWSSGSSTSSATGLAAGNYSVAITDANGCTNSATVSVSAGPVLTPTISANSYTLCNGTSTTLTASGGSSYSWWNIVASTPTVTVSPTANTTFSVSVSLGSCTKDTFIFIAVNPTPTVSISASGNTTFCQGGSVSLSANAIGATSYSWSDGSTTQSITVNASGNYSVSITDVNGCSGNSPLQNVLVNPTPTISISGNNTICSGHNTVLTASGGNSYSWLTVPAQTTSSITTPILNSNTTYTVTGTTSAGCSSFDTLTVQVVPTPTVVNIFANPNTTTICAGNSITLTATGGQTYSWSNGATGATVILAPTMTTNYSVTATNGASCSLTAPITITVTNINASISGNTTLCIGQSTVLTASGGTNYSWSNGSSNASITVSPTTNTSYSVTVSNTAGCSASTSAQVNVNSIPNPTVTASSNPICLGQSSVLSAGGGQNYSWWSGGQTTSSITVTPTSSGNISYSVSVGNSAQCHADTFITVHVNKLPGVNVIVPAPYSYTICPGDSTTLQANSSSTLISYSWTPSSLTGATVVVYPAITTTYTVLVTDTNSCSNTASATINVSSIIATATSDKTTICPGFTAHLNVSTSGNNSSINYLWYGPVNDSTAQNPSATLDSTTTFVVEVSNQDGCWDKDTLTVTVSRDASCVIHIYNGITPNGDGDNDVWAIDGIQSFPKNNVKIFNRWGAKVWEASGYNNKDIVWKGKNSQGHDLPDGTYYYIVELYDTDGSVLFSASKWVEVTH